MPVAVQKYLERKKSEKRPKNYKMILEKKLEEQKAKNKIALNKMGNLLDTELKESISTINIKIINLMKAVVADYYSLDPKHVFLEQSRKRTRELVTARQVYCYLMCKNTSMPLEIIGKSINKDHATVIHAKRKIVDLMEFDKTLAFDVEKMQSIYECTEGGSDFINEVVPYFINMREFYSARSDNKRAVLMTGLTESEMNEVCKIIGVDPGTKKEHKDNPFYII